MTAATDNTHEEISLWTSFHDGSLLTLVHDALACTVALTIEVPYIADFHNMPAGTVFKLVLDKVSLLDSAEFHPWPGTIAPAPGLAWQEQEAIRKQWLDKSHYCSTDWIAFAESLTQGREFEISNAFISPSLNNASTLVLDIGDSDTNIYLRISLTATRIHFFVDDEELEPGSFLSLGEAYWNAFAKRGTTAQTAS
jgi:hypothetical protein